MKLSKRTGWKVANPSEHNDPITVATESYQIKQVILDFMRQTTDDDKIDGEIPFKLHDFGYRGVSSNESAGIGGLAHLTNFMGTDTLEAILYGRRYYNADMAGFSIPAAEHSTVTSWGRENEIEAYRNMIQQFSREGSIYAVVSDSYDLDNAVKEMWGKLLKDDVINGKGVLVVRPDSGYPVEVVLRTLRNLDNAFGSTINTKGYKVLNNVRVIQGDGINQEMIYDILKAMKMDGFSAENVAFGFGGGLLQGNDGTSVNRDTHRFAMKCSAIRVNGELREVYKDPITDKGKVSKKGVLRLVERAGEFKTITLQELEDYVAAGWTEALDVVYEDGITVKSYGLDTVRIRS